MISIITKKNHSKERIIIYVLKADIRWRKIEIAKILPNINFWRKNECAMKGFTDR